MDVEGNGVDSDTTDVRGMAIRRAREAAAAAAAEISSLAEEGEARKVRVGVVARTDLGVYKNAKELLKLTKETVATAAGYTGGIFDKHVAALPGGRDTKLLMCKVHAEKMEEAIARKGDLYELIMTYDVSCAGYETGVVFEMDNDLAEAVHELAAALVWLRENKGEMLRFHVDTNLGRFGRDFRGMASIGVLGKAEDTVRMLVAAFEGLKHKDSPYGNLKHWRVGIEEGRGVKLELVLRAKSYVLAELEIRETKPFFVIGLEPADFDDCSAECEIEKMMGVSGLTIVNHLPMSDYYGKVIRVTMSYPIGVAHTVHEFVKVAASKCENGEPTFGEGRQKRGRSARRRGRRDSGGRLESTHRRRLR
jgi:hypothetical protein